VADTEVRSESALFVVVGEDTVLPTALSRGPWSLGLLHGGPVAALLAHAVEQLASDGVDWFIARLTVELERPVPVEPLRYHAEVTRAGRKVSIVEAVITKADTGAVLARARALRIRAAHVPLPLDDKDLGPMLAIEPAPSEPAEGRPGGHDENAAVAFHNGGTERRFVGESELGVGPVFGWIRVCVPLLPEHTLTPLQRVAAAVDFASGISGVLPWDSHSFVNPDLTIHLFRALRGEWVGMASVTHHSDHGIGMTDTAVFDLDGRVGNSNQSLLLDLR
jgi:acyl-coenzyme A thioesterase PaaI-like protein